MIRLNCGTTCVMLQRKSEQSVKLLYLFETYILCTLESATLSIKHCVSTVKYHKARAVCDSPYTASWIL